jgi:hypothetical protein
MTIFAENSLGQRHDIRIPIHLPDGLGRTIWLGTDHPDHFVKEIMYAISETGTFYEYDPVSDEWTVVALPFDY